MEKEQSKDTMYSFGDTFKNSVMDVYGANEYLKAQLDSFNVKEVIRILNDEIMRSMVSPEAIIAAYERGGMEDVYRKSKRCVELKKILSSVENWENDMRVINELAGPPYAEPYIPQEFVDYNHWVK